VNPGVVPCRSFLLSFELLVVTNTNVLFRAVSIVQVFGITILNGNALGFTNPKIIYEK